MNYYSIIYEYIFVSQYVSNKCVCMYISAGFVILWNMVVFVKSVRYYFMNNFIYTVVCYDRVLPCPIETEHWLKLTGQGLYGTPCIGTFHLQLHLICLLSDAKYLNEWPFPPHSLNHWNSVTNVTLRMFTLTHSLNQSLKLTH